MAEKPHVGLTNVQPRLISTGVRAQLAHCGPAQSYGASADITVLSLGVVISCGH